LTILDKTEFAILGAGAIGSIVGAHLVKAGHSVVMLARGRRAQQIQADGLCVRGLAEISTPVQTLTDPTLLKSADVLIIATKALSTAESLQPLRNTRVGLALSVQNGLMKNELLAETFGAGHTLGALAYFSGELLPSGEVQFTRNVNFTIGELAGGVSPRAERLANTIDASGVRSTAVPDIQAQEWSKFAAWVGMAAMSVTLRMNTWKYLVDPDAAQVFIQVVREIDTLARACGVTIIDNAFVPVATLSRGPEEDAINILHNIGNTFRATPHHRLSILQDIDSGRPLEVEETLGFAARKARQLSLSLPLLDAIYRIAAAVDRDQRN
jgi:2-dehydropantoate 2-reductase